MEKIILNILLVIALLVISTKFLIYYIKILIKFIFNLNFNWNKYIDKPRVFFFIVTLSCLYIIVQIKIENIYLYWIIYVLKIISILITIYFSQFIWSKKFELKFIPKVTDILSKKSNNFNLSYSDAQYEFLYYSLKKEELINYNKTSLEIFKQVLKEDFLNHKNQIFFKLTTVDFRLFYNHFIEKSGTSLIDFSKNSNKVIWSKKNTQYNYATLISNRNEVTKKSDILSALAKKVNTI
jgi:hypothetical protein